MNKIHTVIPMGAMVALLVIWSIPGTIALRTLLLLLLFIYVFANKNKIGNYLVAGPAAWALFLGFGLFSGWAIFHAFIFSQEPEWSLAEWSGQHTRAWIAIAIGLGLGCLFSMTMFRLIKFALLLCLLLHLVDFLWFWIDTGKTFLPNENTITGRIFGQKLLISYLANLYGAFLCAEILVRAAQSKFTFNSRFRLAAEGFFLLVMTVLIGARNGYIGLALLAITTVFSYIYLTNKREKKYWLGAGVGVFFLVGLLGLVSWNTDERWSRFYESALSGLDGERSMAWLNDQKYPLPMLSDGRPADHSAYMRVSGLRGAVEAAFEFPLGYGYGRNAYSHAWKKLKGEGRGSSLSGLGDVLVGLGFPGLLIWIGFSFSLIYFSLKAFLLERKMESLVVIFIAGGFLGRALIDSNIRDHSLEMFLFLVAALTGAASNRRSQLDP